MDFAVDDGCGRSVIATADYHPGDLVHQELAYAMARVDKSHPAPSRQRYCVHCWKAIRGQPSAKSTLPRSQNTVDGTTDDVNGSANGVLLPIFGGADSAAFIPCTRCSSADYCSVSCFAHYHEEHVRSGECAALCALQTVAQKSGKGAIPVEDWNTFATVVVAIARAKSEGLDSLLGVTMNSDTVAAGQMLNDPHQPNTEPCLAVASVVETDACNAVQTVGLGTEGPLPSFYDAVTRPSTAVIPSATGSSTRVPRRASFKEMQRLVTNRTSMDAEIREDYAQLYNHYVQLMRTSRKSSRPGRASEFSGSSTSRDIALVGIPEAAAVEKAPLPDAAPLEEEALPLEGSASPSASPLHREAAAPTTPSSPWWWRDAFPEDGAVSFDVFLNLCCAFQANGFGVWDSRGRGVAAGFFPCSSFFNHSCAPNLARRMDGRCVTFVAAKHIAKGEPICLSYVDFKLPREVRRAKLLATYSFLCRCPRCDDVAAIDHREWYDVPLCHSCTSKILCPVRDDSGQLLGECPCCLARIALDA